MAENDLIHFDLPALAQQFPDTAETMLLDRYLSDSAAVSTRIFRVYRATPPHFHRGCDEHLYVLGGRGTFWVGDPQHTLHFGPGTLLIFKRLAIHAMPLLLEGPLVFLAFDTPRRDPADVHFVDAEDGSAETFIRSRG